MHALLVHFFFIYQIASNLNKTRTDKEPNMASSLAPLKKKKKKNKINKASSRWKRILFK